MLAIAHNVSMIVFHTAEKNVCIIFKCSKQLVLTKNMSILSAFFMNSLLKDTSIISKYVLIKYGGKNQRE